MPWITVKSNLLTAKKFWTVTFDNLKDKSFTSIRFIKSNQDLYNVKVEKPGSNEIYCDWEKYFYLYFIKKIFSPTSQTILLISGNLGTRILDNTKVENLKTKTIQS